MDATLLTVVGAVVALQALQTVQIAILRRDVRRTLYPPPPPTPTPLAPSFRDRREEQQHFADRCVVCGEQLTRAELERARSGPKICSAHY